MKILLTGNMGYVGPGLEEQLRRSRPEATLAGFDMGFFAHCLSGAQMLPERRLDVQHFGDLRDLDERVLEGVDAVVHLAGISNDPMGKAFEDVTADINHRASVRLAQQAKAAGVRAFVFASSCSVYGYAEGAPRDESAELNPLTAYARSKIQTEQDIQPLADEGFVITSLRFATACGMSERLRLDLVLNDFVAGAVAGGEINILSDGTPWRPLITVDDMARAIDWAIDRPAGQGGAFLAVNTGSDEWNYQVRDLAAAVRELMPRITVSINEKAQPDKRSYKVDFGLFRRLAPRHQPQVDLKDAVRGLRDGLAAMRFSDREFRSSDFMRLRVLSGFRERGILTERLQWAQA